MLFESRSTSITFVLTVPTTSLYTQCMVNEDALKVCGQDNDVKNVVPIRGFFKNGNKQEARAEVRTPLQWARLGVHTMSSGVSLGLEDSFTESIGPEDWMVFMKLEGKRIEGRQLGWWGEWELWENREAGTGNIYCHRFRQNTTVALTWTSAAEQNG